MPTERMLIKSLKASYEIKVQFKMHEYFIRSVFDDFFPVFSSFQHHVETGLIKVEDIKPYLEYWIKCMNGYGKSFTAQRLQSR